MAWSEFWASHHFLRAYNSVGNKGLNLKSYVPNNPLKTCRKQIFVEIKSSLGCHIGCQKSKEKIFTNFCHILALKYQSNCQSILNICSLYKSATMMKQIKTKYHKHLLKNSCTATCRSLPWYFKDWKICHLWMAKILGEQYFFFFFFFFFNFLGK